MTHVLVIGGTNFIGPDVVHALVARGEQVTVLHRGVHEIELPDEVVHVHDDRSAVSDHVAALRPEVIVDMMPVHADHAVEVMRAAAAPGVRRVVAVSSMDVYRAFDVVHRRDGHLQPVPLTEESEVRSMRHPYADQFDDDHPMARYDKLDVEERVLTSNAAEGVVLRLPVVFGPRDWQHRVGPLVRRMDDGMPAIVLPASMAAWRFGKAYSGDVASAVALACRHPAAGGGVFNIQSFGGTELEWARRVAATVGWDGEFVVLDDDELPEDMRPDGDMRQDLVADSTRIRSELGWAEEVGVDEGLRRTVAWEREHPDADFTYDAESETTLARRGGAPTH